MQNYVFFDSTKISYLEFERLNQNNEKLMDLRGKWSVRGY